MSALVKTHYKNLNATIELVNKLVDIIDENAVIVCIGTDKCIGDALGPIVGTMLKENKYFNNIVYGTIDNPLHGLNISELVPKIKEKHKDSTILAIDAAVSRFVKVGSIRIDEGPINPGSGAHKRLKNIGDYSIRGIIDTPKESSMAIIRSLYDINLDFVIEMAEIIANAISYAINSVNKTERRISYEI